MTWSYSLALTDTKDQVRLLVGDTEPLDQQLQDEEIAFFLVSEANVYMAAYRSAKSIAARYTRKADKSVGDLKISYKDIADNYMDLAKELLASGSAHQVPTAGGIYIRDTKTYEGRADLRHGAVKRSMNDFTSTSTNPNTEGN